MHNMAKGDLNYVCPLTHSPLRVESDTLRSASGGVVYRLVAGIPQFLRFSPAENGEAQSQLDQLNQLAKVSGWRTALHSVYGENASFLRYVANEARASFIKLLPLTKRSDVLEIGPGLGQFTSYLASRAKSVYALEVVAGQAAFTAERCRQEGMSNVHVATGGDDCRLPYPNEMFDVVIVNLVLEWCASRCLDEDIIDVQRRFLVEICRVLKRGGVLYLATKNRFALRHLIGKRDPHCHGIRFGSALPRWLALLLIRLKGHTRPLGMLHSHRALAAMLHGAGFGRADSFWATPEMRYPTHYVPTDATSILEARRQAGFVQGESRSTRLLMQFIPASLVKHITPGLAFLATKPY